MEGLRLDLMEAQIEAMAEQLFASVSADLQAFVGGPMPTWDVLPAISKRHWRGYVREMLAAATTTAAARKVG